MGDKKPNNTCSKCGKPVYFAERKTSLGRDWHPSCLKCEECGKVLVPGQHAEHQGLPYCHIPCYRALFGPQMVGYGSNVASQSNFRKSSEVWNGSQNSIIEEGQDGITCVYKTTATSPLLVKSQRNSIGDDRRGSGESPVAVRLQRPGSDISLSSRSSSGSISEKDKPQKDSGLKCVYESGMEQRRASANIIPSVSSQSPKPTSVTRSHSDVGRANAPQKNVPVRGAELFKRVQSYNEYNAGKRGQALTLTEENGNVKVQGPLRIYWGLKKPIILKQYDDVPSVPTPKKRYSVYTDPKDLQPLAEIEPQEEHGSPLSPRKSHVLDDSGVRLSSPLSDVVMRRTNIRKSNTVAYRGDKPNKWKRASINGHIYNFDTSVFTPVLGSCTSVTVDQKMTATLVIKTLLDKFKVENEAAEYNLYIITEHDGERLLKDSDIPLLERLAMGPSDSVKLFIRDKPDAPANSPHSHIPEPSQDTTHLPEEVEQLLNIPEPVLRGLLTKFKNDEDEDIRRLKGKYERIRKRVRQIIEDKKANISRC